MTPAGPPQTYPFQSGADYTWLREFAATSLPTTTNSVVTLETITSIATDNGGNVVGVGYDLGSLNGFSNPNNVAEGYVVKYDSSGNQAWVTQFGTGSGDFLQGVSLDLLGNIYAVGITRGALPGYSNPDNTIEGGLYKFSSSGSLVWEKQFTIDSAYTNAFKVSCDPQGNPVVGGVFNPHSAPQYQLVFLQKFDASTGNTVWSNTIGTASLNNFEDLTSDENGQIYVSGETTGAYPGGISGSGVPFLSAFSGATGQNLWEQTIAVSGFSNVVPFAIYAKNQVVVVGGAMSNSIVGRGFDVDPVSSAFLSEASSSTGHQIWSKTYTTGEGDQITGVGISATGSIFATGTTNGAFASGFTVGINNVFLLRVGSDGSNVSASQFGTGQILNQFVQAGPQIAIASHGGIFVGGGVQKPYPGYSNTANNAQMFISSFLQ